MMDLRANQTAHGSVLVLRTEMFTMKIPKFVSLFPRMSARMGWLGSITALSAAVLVALVMVFAPVSPLSLGNAAAAGPQSVPPDGDFNLASVETFLSTEAGQQDSTPELGQSVYLPVVVLTQVIYLPTINRYQPPRQSVFGVEIYSRIDASLAGQAAEAGATWVRYGAIRWDQIESIQGQRNWSLLADFDRSLAVLQAQGFRTSIVVLGAPTWAQRRPPWMCGAMREDALDDFASFMQALVRRYSGPPYYVKYWELGNEPDVDPSYVGPDSGFGCWGDLADPYYGGAHYATMLKAVYPAIKAVDPQAQVVSGGLLMDCDPTHPPADSRDGCLSGKFFEGILRGGGAPYFDILAYHAYSHWNDHDLDDDLTHFKWSARGGVLLGKASLLREVMARYGVNKPLLMNEGGVLCYPTNPDCPGNAFRHGQAVGLIKLYARTWANNIDGAIWYTLNGPGWREGGLLESDKTPRPAYTSMRFMSSLLRHARFTKTISTAQMEGYEFEDNAFIYRLYWTNNAGLTVQIPVTIDIQTVYNAYGQIGTAGGSTIPVSFDPVVLVLRK